MTSDLIVIFLLSPQAKKSVSVEEVSVQTAIPMGWAGKAPPFLRIPFQQGRSPVGIEETVHGNLPANKAKYRCWNKRSIGRIVTADSQPILILLFVLWKYLALLPVLRLLCKRLCNGGGKVVLQRAARTFLFQNIGFVYLLH